MTHRLTGILFFILSSYFSYSQSDTKTDTVNVATSSGKLELVVAPDSSKVKSSKELIIAPTIGVGTGMFSFYGDIYTKHFQAPSVSRMAYDLTLSQRLNDYLQFNFYVLFGTLGADERNAGPNNNRNLNFQSQIRAGGVYLEYNFDNFLPKNRVVSPFVCLGFESFEFLSKTDVKDSKGNTYYYWSDGSIRNMAQNDANAVNAVIINRDFKYESDIREMNLDGFGKYPERSFAIPVGAGVILKLNDFFDFKMGAVMHFTFTDYIDGITDKSVGIHKGNSANDNFMMTSIAVRYNFGVAKSKKKKEAIKNLENYKNVDFAAIDADDEDKDGVLDFADLCPGTPAGVKVDANGCPLDDDGDGVPNYRDDEKNSHKGAIVNSRGVTLSDSLLAYQSSFYNDETGAFATVENRDKESIDAGQKEYSVELGTFKKGLSPTLMTKFLGISDIASYTIHDSTTIYTAGKFDNYQDAEKRRQQLLSDGITEAKVIYKQNGKYNEAPVYASAAKNNNPASTTTNTITFGETDNSTASNPTANIAAINNEKLNKPIINNPASTNSSSTKNTSKPNTNSIYSNQSASDIVFRIQLGAFKKRLSKTVFKNVKDLMEIKTDDGVYKYMAGSFTSMDAAAKYKVEMSLNGYPGAFISAYKNGKRVSLQEAGATFDKKENVVEKADNTAFSGVNKKQVIFKVQLGVFKNRIPDHQIVVFSKLKNISGEKNKNGLTRYVVGSFNDYKEAEAFKNDIKKTYKLGDIFVVAMFNDEYIPVKEAIELVK